MIRSLSIAWQLCGDKQQESLKSIDNVSFRQNYRFFLYGRCFLPVFWCNDGKIPCFILSRPGNIFVYDIV